MNASTLTLVLLTSATIVSACKKEAGGKPAGSTPAANRLAISVTEKGFEPADLTVTKGQPVTLVFERKTDNTCAKQVVVHIDDKQTIEKDLPLNQPVEVTATFPTSGDLAYACGMDMVKGVIHVQ